MAGRILPKELHIETMQTAIPCRVTEPGRRPRHIAAAAAYAAPLFQSRFRIILYYRSAGKEESAWTVAAWMKESLGAALAERPELAGRLRRAAVGAGEGGWEVKLNDAGVRLVQAAVAEVSMAEFLEAAAATGTAAAADKEAPLAFWVDVDAENPEFSALFYVQVTQFQGDGYAIGICCSLLLADPLFLIQFLKSWAETQTQMLAQGLLTKTPIFHLGHFQRPTHPKHLKSIPFDSSTASTVTVLFKISYNGGRDELPYKAIAFACLKEAAERVKGKVVDKFCLMINYGDGVPKDLRIESCTRPEVPSPPVDLQLDGTIKMVQWDQFGIEELTLTQENKPVHVTYQMISPSSFSSNDEGLVVIMSPYEEIKGVSEMMISITIPKK
uniref:Protein ECERIFERUM 26-like n=1 Tax=Ananas comosus var. bracteatus TaxID=296719 RepID=A0A6V7NJF7_ANACO|nr:unnamed protein product [Ananas comosus var. bracteatus]